MSILEAVWKQSLYKRRLYVICGARLRTDILDNRSLAMLLEISKGLIYQTLVSGQPLKGDLTGRAACGGAGVEVARDLGPDTAEVKGDRGKHGVLAASFKNLHEGHLQAFGIDVAGDTTQHPTDVWPVGHRGGERHDLAIMEDRQREDHVVEVTAHHIAVVGEQNIPGR